MKDNPTFKKVFLIILSALLGAFFVFSAWTKTQPIQYFEYTIESQIHLPHNIAALAARFFIGLEAGLGLLLLANVYGYRRWVLKACIALLILFSIELFYLLLSHGNDVNCGCMGDIAPMSPLVSLLKNVVLITCICLLLKWQKTTDGPIVDWGSIPFCALLVSIPFFVFPITKQITMPLSRLYSTTLSDHPKVELRKGKHIVCFMSLTCPHCRNAATKIAQLVKSNPSLPFYLALASGTDSTREERFKDFVADTKIHDIPYHFLASKDFMYMIQSSGSNGVPVILWMQDTTVVRKVNMDDLNQKEIETWISQ